jgi:hypothetical protein
MAKYRITSLPQSLPKAQKGLFNKENKISVRNGEVKLFPNLFGDRKRNNIDTQDQSDNTQYNWSGTTPELMQPGQESFELKPTYAPTPEFTQADVNLSSTLSKIQEERNRLAQEKENRDWEEMMKKRDEQFKTSKKYDKIEPLLTIDSEGYTDEDLAYFQESGYFPVKDPKTNKINLYPSNEISSRIINNGLRTNEIVKKLGIGDAESVKSAFGDLMTAADQQYSATVQNKLLQKSLDEGISLEDAVKKLSGKLGTEKGLQKYVAPTKDLINNYIDEIKKNVNQPAEKEIQSMYYDNRNPDQGYSPKIDYNSYDPGLKYNMDYYNTTNNWGQFLKDYSDYNKEYNKEYADSFYNKQNQTADKLNLPVSDRTGNLKNQQDLLNQNISLTKQVGDASTEAGNKTINKKYIEQLQADMARVSDPLVKYELGKKLDAVKNNPEAFSKLLKGFESGEVFTKEDEDNINALTFSILQKESNPDTIKAGVDRPKLTTSDKVFDVLTNPFDAFKYSNQGGLNNMWSSGMGYNERKLLERANPGLDLGTQDNLVGNALNTWNPMRFARDVDSDLDREDYASAGLEALEFATPAMFSKAARAGRLARDASKFFPTGSITPGLKGFTGSAFESLNPYFAYEAIRPGGELNRSYDLLKEGNIKEGLQEGAFGLLNLLPAAGTFKSLKGAENIGGAKPFVSQQLSFKKGGELPTYQGPFRSIVKTVAPIVKNAAGYTERRNLFQNLWTNPINSALMNSAYESLAKGLYKNQSIQPLTDMLGSISNTDAKYLLTDALNQIDNPYENLSNLMSNVDVDYSNIGDFNRNTLDFANRRGHAQKLLDLGYVGDEVTPLDLYKMARTNDSMNAITRNAIDFDRTGYRQVQGQLKPIGNLQDGYGPRGQFQYDMRRRASGAPRSEFENMALRSVDKSNPLSIAEYQATSIPMEQYGYRAGVPDMSQQDALYLTSLPTRQSYGPYQFKIKQDLDLSGNWKDWMQKYVYDKPTLHLNANRENDLSKIYFNIGAAKGVPGRASDPLTNVARGTGLHTRQWISGKGNQIGSIDPTFRFTDLKNMSAEDYLEMEREKEELIKLFNTGWRGQYKKGGSMELELTPKQIKEYIKAGYIIEDI